MACTEHCQLFGSWHKVMSASVHTMTWLAQVQLAQSNTDKETSLIIKRLPPLGHHTCRTPHRISADLNILRSAHTGFADLNYSRSAPPPPSKWCVFLVEISPVGPKAQHTVGPRRRHFLMSEGPPYLTHKVRPFWKGRGARSLNLASKTPRFSYERGPP